MLFHHALGLTEGVTAFADQLRRAGHIVHTPDLYGGRTYPTLQDAITHVDKVGFEVLTEVGRKAAEDLSPGLVYIGFSLGVGPAQKLAQTRTGARGAVLISACLPVTEFGASWPTAVPVEIHAKKSDPEFDNGWDLPAARTVVDHAEHGELFPYPGEELCLRTARCSPTTPTPRH